MRMPGRPLNPVLARELRQRMRGPRAAVLLTVYLVLLVIILQALYAAVGARSDFDGPAVENTAALGRTIFQTLLFFVLGLVCFIVPSVTAGAISGERERQTLVPLQVTLLRPRQILIGKLLASVAFVVLLIVATLPLAGISFLLGGIEPLEVVRATAMVLVVALVVAALSLWCSTYLRTTSGATVVAMAMAFGLCVGTFLAYGTQRVLDRGQETTSQLVLVLNPFMAVADVLDRRPEGFSGGESPFTPMQDLLRERGNRPGRFVGGPGEIQIVEPMPGQVIVGDEVPGAGEGPLSHRVPLWIESLAAFALLSFAALALAARRLHMPRAVLR
ncbi:MAG: ABC transporter permease [Actinobacteria bacterium]|nr:ABC transporter permease [Actinomycetota bacterium]